MRVSQKEIAERLGVTRVTVTRALGGSPLVSAELKAQIQALGEEMGYHAHYGSRSLRSAKSMVLSVIRFDARLTDLHSRWVSRLQQEARKAGYMLRLDPSAGFARILGEGSADGFFVFDVDSGDDGATDMRARLRDGSVNAVVLDCPTGMYPTDTVLTDNAGGMAQATRFLSDLGHRRMAYLGVAGWGVGAERYGAFQEELANCGLPEGSGVCIPHDRWAEDITDVLTCADQLMAAVAAGVTAVVAASDLFSAGAIRILLSHGLSVPRDVSVVGYDDSLLARAYSPPITTVLQNAEEAARVAVAMLLARMASGTPQPNRFVPADLIVRGSSGPPPPCHSAID